MFRKISTPISPRPRKAFVRLPDRARGIVCLQELFRSVYFCQVEDHKYFELAEPVPGPTTETMAALARELDVVIVASLFERRAPGIYHNTAAIIDAGGTYLGKYRKMHIPDDPLFYEKFYFTPGDLGFAAWDTKFARIGVCVCWDQWYPGGSAADGAARRTDSLLPHRHRLASRGKGPAWLSAAFLVGDRAARSRCGEWLLCRCSQPRWSRGS